MTPRTREDDNATEPLAATVEPGHDASEAKTPASDLGTVIALRAALHRAQLRT
ncbi:MAG: hypothetical protein ACXWXJ_09380 [Aeromicrobium sp.]